jgi:hypothetical protein
MYFKRLFDEIKSYKNELNHLNNKIESLKLEMQYQQNEYTRQIRQLLEEKENILASVKKSSHNNYVFVNGSNHDARDSSLKITYNINENGSENEGNFDNDSTTNVNEIQQFDNSYNDVSDNMINKQSYRSSVQVITTKTYAIPYDADENDGSNDEENENNKNTKITIKKNEKTSARLNNPNVLNKSEDRSSEMKHQITMLENQVKETVEKNNLLIDQYEKNVQYLNEQIKFFKVS